MRLKTFIADSMSKAMDLVLREMGEDAIIVATQSTQNGRSVRLTAALEDDTGRDQPPISGDSPHAAITPGKCVAKNAT